MTDNGWVKIHRKMTYDADIRALSPGRRWMFVSFILAANPFAPHIGYLLTSDAQPMSLHDMADVAGVDCSSVSRALSEFIELGLITKNGHGWYKVTNYTKYQSTQVLQNATDEHETSDFRVQSLRNATSVAKRNSRCVTQHPSVAKSNDLRNVQARKPPPKKDDDIETARERLIDLYGKLLRRCNQKWDELTADRLALWVEEFGEDEVRAVLVLVLSRETGENPMAYVAKTLANRAAEQTTAAANAKPNDNPYGVGPDEPHAYAADPAYPGVAKVKIPLWRMQELYPNDYDAFMKGPAYG